MAPEWWTPKWKNDFVERLRQVMVESAGRRLDEQTPNIRPSGPLGDDRDLPGRCFASQKGLVSGIPLTCQKYSCSSLRSLSGLARFMRHHHLTPPKRSAVVSNLLQVLSLRLTWTRRTEGTALAS